MQKIGFQGVFNEKKACNFSVKPNKNFSCLKYYQSVLLYHSHLNSVKNPKPYIFGKTLNFKTFAVNKNPNIKLSYLHSTGKVWGMPFRKDDAELRGTVEKVIECMKIDGTIAGLHEKWFGVAPAAGSAAVTPLSGFGQPGYDGHESNGHSPSC